MHITWSHDQWVTWLGGWDSFTLNQKGYSKNIYALETGADLLYYKLGQTLLQIGAALLLEIIAGVVRNCGSY